MARTKEEIAAYAREWRKANRGRINARLQERYATEPELRAKMKARNKAWSLVMSAGKKAEGLAKLDAWAKANPERARKARRKQYRVRCMGVHPADATGETPSGPCEICIEPQAQLHLDHNHATGRFRGWLCGNCNRGLGMYADDPSRVQAAARYLQRTARPLPGGDIASEVGL